MDPNILQQLQAAANSQKSFADKLREQREARTGELNQFQNQVNTPNDFQTPGGVPLNPADVVNAKSLFAKSMSNALSPFSPELEQKALGSQADILSQIYQLQQGDAKLADDGSDGTTIDDLLDRRKKLMDAGLDTSVIDAELNAQGYGEMSVNKSVIDQINSLKGADKTGARAVKDILDVIDRAEVKFNDLNRPGIGRALTGEGTGPLSALASLIGKTAGGVPETSQLDKELSEILRVIRKESTGVAFSPQEIKDLQKEIPSIMQQEGNVADSLVRLKQRMIQKLTNYGVDVSNRQEQSVDQQTSDPLGLGI